MSLRVRVVIALVSGLVAVSLLALYIADIRGQATGQREEALGRYGGEVVEVCVATHEMARGEVFSERNVGAAEWLVDLLPVGAVIDPLELYGKTASGPIAQNTPLALTSIDAQATPLDVPAGKVAVSVPCSSQNAVGGSLTPNAIIDMYVVSSGKASLLCRGVQVLRTNVSGTAGSLSWAVLAVYPNQVEPIIAASSTQGLYLVLPSDDVSAGQGDEGAVATGRLGMTGVGPADGAGAVAYWEDGSGAVGGSGDDEGPQGTGLQGTDSPDAGPQGVGLSGADSQWDERQEWDV